MNINRISIMNHPFWGTPIYGTYGSPHLKTGTVKMISVQASRVSPVGIVLMLPDGRWQDIPMVEMGKFPDFIERIMHPNNLLFTVGSIFFCDSHEG